MNSKKSEVLQKKDTHVELSNSQPSENILIISVLKRLESIADLNEQDTEYHYQHANNHRYFAAGKGKKTDVNITPMQLYERTKSMKKKSTRNRY